MSKPKGIWKKLKESIKKKKKKRRMRYFFQKKNPLKY